MSGSISVNSVMKSTLKEATDKFEVNLNSDEGFGLLTQLP